MSPEQARGKPVDRRSDIWSFGVVLFECLTGKRLFPGETVTDSIGALLHKEIDWSRLPPNTPPGIQLLLRKCLARDRKRRLPDIGAARLDLEQAVADPGSSLIRLGPGMLRDSRAPAGRDWLKSSVLILFALLLGGGGAVSILGRFKGGQGATDAPTGASRWVYTLPKGQGLRATSSRVLAVSPDGRSFVYNDSDGIYLRRLDELTAHVIPGTEERLRNPVFSPDGLWIAYYDEKGWLKRIQVTGGTSKTICPAGWPFGDMEWEDDGSILFCQRQGILRVPASGGSPTEVISARNGELLDTPQILPDGDTVLFTAWSKWNQLSSRTIAEPSVVSQKISTGERTVLVEGGHDGRYLPTGHLVYVMDGNLHGVPFDFRRLARAGHDVILKEQGPMGRLGQGAYYDVSTNGTLVWIHGASIPTDDRQLLWIDQNGKERPIPKVPHRP